MMRLVDSHAHLGKTAARLSLPLADALRSWFASGGTLLLDAGTDPGDLGARRAAVESACAMLRSEGSTPLDASFFFSAGAWPGTEVLCDPEASRSGLVADIAAGACAVGECGLDFFHKEAPEADQIAFFESCCSIAAEKGLPLIIHSRDAHAQTLDCLRRYPSARPAIIHCFSYDREAAAAYLDSGCIISFAGNLSYKNASALREAAALVPLDSLLVETDAPYLAPVPQRGKPCQPEMVKHTLECLADIKGIAAEELAEAVESNFKRIFRLTYR